MPMPIRTDSVCQAMIPFLGSALVLQTPTAENAANVLRGYSPYKTTLSALCEQLSNRLFSDLYNLLGPRMAVQLDNGQTARLRISDLPDLADAVMGVLFDAMTISPDHQYALTEYAMQQTSLSAMRVLLLKYASSISDPEKAIMGRIIRDNYPPHRYEDWLKC